MYRAHAVYATTGKDTSRPFDSAELAARHLLILLRADGWTGDPADTVNRLAAGETLTHKRFSYSVTPDA